MALNDELPADINVLALEPAPSASTPGTTRSARSYLYQISRRRTALSGSRSCGG